jgi:hypothetical protein
MKKGRRFCAGTDLSPEKEQGKGRLDDGEYYERERERAIIMPSALISVLKRKLFAPPLRVGVRGGLSLKANLMSLITKECTMFRKIVQEEKILGENT